MLSDLSFAHPTVKEWVSLLNFALRSTSGITEDKSWSEVKSILKLSFVLIHLEYTGSVNVIVSNCLKKEFYINN